MNKHLALGGLLVALAGCGPKVVSNPKADADVDFYAGTDPVTVGSAIAVMVSWHAWCEQPSFGGEGGGSPHSGPCNPVPHTVSFRCEDDACTWKPTGDGGYQLVPTKAGTMHAFVTVTPKHGAAKTYPLQPVEVVVPDTVTMSCARMGDSTSVTLELAHAGRALQASAPALRVNDRACTYNAPLAPGELSSPMTSLMYMCTGAIANARAQIATASYHLDASAPCELSPGATE